MGRRDVHPITSRRELADSQILAMETDPGDTAAGIGGESGAQRHGGSASSPAVAGASVSVAASMPRRHDRLAAAVSHRDLLYRLAEPLDGRDTSAANHLTRIWVSCLDRLQVEGAFLPLPCRLSGCEHLWYRPFTVWPRKINNWMRLSR